MILNLFVAQKVRCLHNEFDLCAFEVMTDWQIPISDIKILGFLQHWNILLIDDILEGYDWCKNENCISYQR